MKDRNVIYVAGPYTAETDFERKQNIQRADEVNADLWKRGYYAICPHKITAFYGGLVPEHVFIDGGLEILRRCDVMVLVKGWEKSNGTIGEIKEAIRFRIPIYRNVNDFIMRRPVDPIYFKGLRRSR